VAQNKNPYIYALPGGRRPTYVGSDYHTILFYKLLMMLPDSTEKRLVLGILGDNANHERRLVYADWLEENGRDDEAKVEREAAETLRRAGLSYAARVAEDGRPESVVEEEMDGQDQARSRHCSGRPGVAARHGSGRDMALCGLAAV
jgi:uncharacterized protein (TIGR02996 family)